MEYESYENAIYDRIDMKNNFNRGYWIGVATGSSVIFMLCLLVGLFVN